MSSTNIVSGLISRRSETSSAPLSPIQFGDVHNPFFFQQQQQQIQQQSELFAANLSTNERFTPQSLQFDGNLGSASSSEDASTIPAPVVNVDGSTHAFHLERMSSRLPEKEEVVIGGAGRSGSVVTLESVTQDSTAAANVSENGEASVTSSTSPSDNLVLFDSDLMSWTRGFPLPLTDAAKKHLDAALRRDCDFLSEAEVIDYSLLVGVDIESGQIRIGIVDYLRRFDIVKRVENRVKAVAQLATNVEPTVVQPSRYGERLLRASERYFMSVRQIE